MRPMLLGMLLAGCGGAGDEATPANGAPVQDAPSLPADVAAALDAGNAAYRADDYQEALDRYAEATELGPEVSAGWFGVYMAQLALGDTVAAEEAMTRARALSPGEGLGGHPVPEPEPEPEGGR